MPCLLPTLTLRSALRKVLLLGHHGLRERGEVEAGAGGAGCHAPGRATAERCETKERGTEREKRGGGTGGGGVTSLGNEWTAGKPTQPIRDQV